MMGFHPDKFGLPRPFCSPVMSRHATDGHLNHFGQTDGQTDRQTDNRGQFIMPPPLWGQLHNNSVIDSICYYTGILPPRYQIDLACMKFIISLSKNPSATYYGQIYSIMCAAEPL